MQKNGKLFVIVPAFNEEKVIGKTINLIRKTGVNAEIIVVNDGSTDHTVEIAKEKGCIVVSLPKNLGKARAFFAGIKEALKRNADAAITIDADTTRIPKTTMEKLATKALAATRGNKTKMFVAPFREKFDFAVCSGFTALFYSGVRSFSRQALWSIKSSKLKNVPERSGLEHFQSSYFRNNAIAISAPAVRQAQAFRNGNQAAIDQGKDIKVTQYRMRKRGMYR